MNRASPVDLRKCLEAAHGLAHIGIRFVPVPVATEEEFQALSAELSRKLEQMAVEAEKKRRRCSMSAEIIDQANELAERRLEMTIQNMRINHNAVSATHCRDCGEEIPERRRELVAGCQRCADCQEEEELRGRHRRP